MKNYKSNKERLNSLLNKAIELKSDAPNKQVKQLMYRRRSSIERLILANQIAHENNFELIGEFRQKIEWINYSISMLEQWPTLSDIDNFDDFSVPPREHGDDLIPSTFYDELGEFDDFGIY